jgi:hypothetical protein
MAAKGRRRFFGKATYIWQMATKWGRQVLFLIFVRWRLGQVVRDRDIAADGGVSRVEGLQRRTRYGVLGYLGTA